jgi:hypothetical protein
VAGYLLPVTRAERLLPNGSPIARLHCSSSRQA